MAVKVQFLPEHPDVLFLEPSSTTAASTNPEHAVFSGAGNAGPCASECALISKAVQQIA